MLKLPPSAAHGAPDPLRGGHGGCGVDGAEADVRWNGEMMEDPTREKADPEPVGAAGAVAERSSLGGGGFADLPSAGLGVAPFAFSLPLSAPLDGSRVCFGFSFSFATSFPFSFTLSFAFSAAFASFLSLESFSFLSFTSCLSLLA